MGRRRRKSKGKARVIFTKLVRHPGIKAQPFLSPALQGSNVLLSKLVAKTLGRVSTSNPAGFRRALDDNVRAVATAIKVRAQKLAPVVTGRLKGSINVRQIRLMAYSIGTNVEYALWIEEGTDPYLIKPKNKRFLRFTVRGRRKGKGNRRKKRT